MLWLCAARTLHAALTLGGTLGTELPRRVLRDTVPVCGDGGPCAGGVYHPSALGAAPGCHLPPRRLQTRGAAACGGETLW